MRFLPFLVFIFLVSCSSSRIVETQLYFGQSKPDGSMITDNEWKGFKEIYISRVFKEGSTVVNASGNWFDPESRKLIAEPTYVVIYFYKPSALISKQIDSLRNAYKTMFKQQSVLRVDKKVKAFF
ncbi:MAG TPA: DUF3574 domain-containing protein [Chitinophagaceae bacterium]|nr:DUF3574 domain-containing protein [Chitinophagaceae bacterium]